MCANKLNIPQSVIHYTGHVIQYALGIIIMVNLQASISIVIFMKVL